MEVHDHAGHQGVERTLARVMENAYWVGMTKVWASTVSIALNVRLPMLRLTNQPHHNLSWFLNPGRWWQ